MGDVLVSDLFSRLPSMMNVGETQPSSSINEPRPPQHPTDSSHYPTNFSESARPTSSNAANSSGSRLRASSHAHSHHQETPHIRFRSATTSQPLQHEAAQSSGPDLHSQPQQMTHADIPPPSPRLQPTYRSTVSLNGSLASSPSRIKVRDLSHIQSFASGEVLTRSRHPSRHSLRGRFDGGQQYEISAMPVTDIIEMVAGLLTKITTTNDQQHEHLHRHVPPPDGSSGLSQQASSVLAFHGKNVPSITIASYLARIHKYCPTTYEVFISLLIYLDRMTEMVNGGSLSSFRLDEQLSSNGKRGSSMDSHDSNSTVRHPSPTASSPALSALDSHKPRQLLSDADAFDLSHSFVVDSFNIHRLVMAGVTCASKFFSDVFYTNSRYAKVSMLSLPHG